MSGYARGSEREYDDRQAQMLEADARAIQIGRFAEHEIGAPATCVDCRRAPGVLGIVEHGLQRLTVDVPGKLCRRCAVLRCLEYAHLYHKNAYSAAVEGDFDEVERQANDAAGWLLAVPEILGANPQPNPAEWTEHTNTCMVCRRVFRICKVGWDMARENDAVSTDEELALSFELCLQCSFGNAVPGEYIEPAA